MHSQQTPEKKLNITSHQTNANLKNHIYPQEWPKFKRLTTPSADKDVGELRNLRGVQMGKIRATPVSRNTCSNVIAGNNGRWNSQLKDNMAVPYTVKRVSASYGHRT